MSATAAPKRPIGPLEGRNVGSTELVPSDARGRRTQGLFLVLGAIAAVVVLSGCTVNESLFFDLPSPATKEATITQNLWQGSWIAAWAVGAFTWALMLWAAVAYRRRHRDEVPEQTKYNLPIEML